jgi:hypothetical protein
MFVIETFEAGCQPRHRPTAPLSQSRSTPHDREHNLPHDRALSATVLGRTPIPGEHRLIGPHTAQPPRGRSYLLDVQGLKLKNLDGYMLLPLTEQQAAAPAVSGSRARWPGTGREEYEKANMHGMWQNVCAAEQGEQMLL